MERNYIDYHVFEEHECLIYYVFFFLVYASEKKTESDSASDGRLRNREL